MQNERLKGVTTKIQQWLNISSSLSSPLRWQAILTLCPGVFHLSCATFKGRVCIIHLARKSHACAALQRTWLVWLDHKDMNSCLLYWCHYLVGEGWGAKKSVHSTGHFEHQANPNQHHRLVIYQHRRHGHCESPELEDVHPFLLGMPQKWWYDGMTISYCSKPKGETTLLWTCQSCDLGRWLKHCTKLWQRDDEGDGMSMFDLLFFSNKWVVSSFPNSPAPHFVYIQMIRIDNMIYAYMYVTFLLGASSWLQ